MDEDEDEDDVGYEPPDLTKSEEEQLRDLQKSLEELMRLEGAYDVPCKESLPADAAANSPLIPDLGYAPLDGQPFDAPFPEPVRRNGSTEDLLNGLIAECHFLMRAVVLPSTLALDERVRRDFLTSAMDLAKTGATVGKSIAKLRAASRVTEHRQRHVVEHVERQLPTPAPQSKNK